MHKIIFTTILFFSGIFYLSAQDPRFEYKDTTLLNETKTSEVNESVTYPETVDAEKDILSDTTLYLSNVEISPDTIAAWRNDKRFAYVKNLDSLLKVKQQQDIEELKNN